MIFLQCDVSLYKRRLHQCLPTFCCDVPEKPVQQLFHLAIQNLTFTLDIDLP